MFAVMLFLPELIEGWLMLWLIVYLFLAMKRVYAQGVMKTAVKFGMVLFSYTLVLSITMLAALVLAVLTL